MQATWSQPVAEVVVFSNDFASRRARPSRPWATSTPRWATAPSSTSRRAERCALSGPPADGPIQPREGDGTRSPASRPPCVPCLSCPWTPSLDHSRGVDVGRSPCPHRGTCASPRASCSDLYSASAGVTPAREIRRYQTVWSDCLRTRKRRMVASPDRVLLIGSRPVLARPGDEKRMPSPSRTGSTYTRISSTSPRWRH